MPHPGADQDVYVVNSPGAADAKVFVINNEIVAVATGDGYVLLYENGAWTARKLLDADIPAAIARDTEVTAAVAAEATTRAAADTTLQSNITAEAASRVSGDALAVPKSLYDANTVLAADADDTPAALTVPASTFVGRKASGGISAMSVTEALAVLGGLQAPTVQASAVSHTGDGTETTLASHTVSQGGLGTKGYLRVSAQGICTGTGTTHVRIYWGSTVLNDCFITDPWTWWFDALIAYYNNDQASWACNLRRWQGNSPRPSATPNINFVGDRKTGTLDLSAGTGLLKITGQLISNTADTVTCDGFVAEPVYVA